MTRFNDIHVHCFGKPKITPAELLKCMDKAGMEHVVILSDYGHDLKEQKANMIKTGKFIAEAPDRLYGLAWIEPRHKTPMAVLDWAINDLKYRGFKMIPNNWYPCDEPVLKYCEKISSLKVPCLFHSGILYFETLSSRFCRPAYYEALLKVPRFRFALAHISWPWTDECLALFGQARSAAQYGYSTAEMYIDLTPGTPPDYRENALRRLLDFGAEDRMIYGTDLFLSSVVKGTAGAVGKERALFKKLGMSAKTMDKIFRRNFEKFFAR